MALVGETLDRVPPQSVESEMAVLGAMLLSADAVVTAMEKITEDVFYNQVHKVIFKAMMGLFDQAVPIDMLTLTEDLRKKDLLDSVGGASYIASLTNSVPSAAHVSHYLKVIFTKSVVRSLITSSTEILSMCYESDADADALLDEAERSIFEIAEKSIDRDFSSAKDLIKDTIKQIELAVETKKSVTGVASGYGDLDKKTAGFQKSDLIVLAARPSMGKTALALNIAEHAALEENIAVAIFSLEMAKQQLIQRLLCSLARMDNSKIRSGFMNKNDWPDLLEAASKLSEAKIFIDDTPGITVMELRAKARRLKSSDDIQLIVIDYLQLMQASSKRYDNRQQEISDISRSLKSLARELEVPVIVLSQLNRSVESRQDHRPMLSDLRESGAIEQDADVVILMVRPDYYDKEERKGETDVMIAKQRNGPVGEITLKFTSECARFDNFTSREDY